VALTNRYRERRPRLLRTSRLSRIVFGTWRCKLTFTDTCMAATMCLGLQDFTYTANSFSAARAGARHGPGYKAPRRPMTLEAGEELVRRIVERWLDELRRVGA
jgi:hypothetical protein